MILDISIGVVLLAAAFLGFRRGLIQPLLAELGFLFTILLILRFRHQFAGWLSAHTHITNPALPVVLALALAIAGSWLGSFIGLRIHRMPVVRGADGFAGVFVNAFFALVMVNLLLAAMVVSYHAFGQLQAAAKMTVAQVNQLERALAKTPFSALLGDSESMHNLRVQAGAGGTTLDSVPGLHAAQIAVNDFLEPQLAASRLAPYVLRFGNAIPLLPKVPVSELPKR